jgi:hypothetical protein
LFAQLPQRLDYLVFPGLSTAVGGVLKFQRSFFQRVDAKWREYFLDVLHLFNGTLFTHLSIFRSLLSWVVGRGPRVAGNCGTSIIVEKEA